MNYFLSIIKYLGIGERTANTIIKKKVNSRLKFMNKKANCLFSERRTLIMALVQCYFYYFYSSWYAGISSFEKQITSGTK